MTFPDDTSGISAVLETSDAFIDPLHGRVGKCGTTTVYGALSVTCDINEEWTMNWYSDAYTAGACTGTPLTFASGNSQKDANGKYAAVQLTPSISIASQTRQLVTIGCESSASHTSAYVTFSILTSIFVTYVSN